MLNESPPSVSPGLEGMLQDPQVTDQRLIGELWQMFATDLSRLAVLAGKTAQVEEIVEQGTAWVVINRHKYWGQVSLRAWMIGRVWRNLSVDWKTPPDLSRYKLNNGITWLALLAYGLFLTATEIAYVLKIKLGAAQVELETLRRSIQDQGRTSLEGDGDQPEQPGSEERVSQEVSSTLLMLPLPVMDAPTCQERILAWVGARRQRRAKLTRFQEMALVGGIIVIVFLLGRFSNRFLPGESFYQALMTPVSRAWLFTPLPFTPQPTPARLGGNASRLDIFQRAGNSRDFWHTLWADVQVIEYGPPGYIGAPQSVLRKQVWIDQPSHIRLVTGPLDGEPTGSYVIIDSHIRWNDFRNGKVYDYQTDDPLGDLDIRMLFGTQELYIQHPRTLGGIVELYGRPAWILDCYNNDGLHTYRYWVDAEYGVVLARREYGQTAVDPIKGNQVEVVLRDVVVTAIVFDAVFPSLVFDPLTWPGSHFANDISWSPRLSRSNADGQNTPVQANLGPTGHEVLSRRSPPSGFNPSHSRLAFQWQEAGAGISSQNVVDMFADGYYLGTMPLGEATVLYCDRSQDGQRIAFVTLPKDDSAQPYHLYWIDLSAPFRINTGVGSATNVAQPTGDLAFAPDGQRLVYMGCSAQNPQGCGVYLLDLATNQSTHLVGLQLAFDFIWKPDGSALAFVGEDFDLQNWYFFIFELPSTRIIQRLSYDWRSLGVGPQSLEEAWGTVMRPHTGGLSACADPP